MLILNIISEILFIKTKKDNKKLLNTMYDKVEIKIPNALLCPALDIKHEIIRSNPNISFEAEKLLSKNELTLKCCNDFHILFDYFYIIEEHNRIVDIVKNAEISVGCIIDHIDFAYLLSAYLYERLGLKSLALENYNRYFNIISLLSKQQECFQSKWIQRRITVVRTKLQYLKYAVPVLRKDYYDVSYLSELIYSFFEHSISNRNFLKKYISNNLIRNSIIFYDDDEKFLSKLSSFIELSKPNETPFAHYELCARKLAYPFAKNRCNLTELINNCNNDYVQKLSIYINARINHKQGHYEKAQRMYKELYQNKDLGAAEFLRDDILIFLAFSYYDEGKENKGNDVLKKLICNFHKGGYDTVKLAETILKWNVPSEALNCTEYLVKHQNYNSTLIKQQYKNIKNIKEKVKISSQQIDIKSHTEILLQLGLFKEKENAIKSKSMLPKVFRNISFIKTKVIKNDIYYIHVLGPVLLEEESIIKEQLKKYGFNNSFKYLH